MTMTRMTLSGIGRTVICAVVAVGTAGCQPETTLPDNPSGAPGLAVEAPREVREPAALADPSPQPQAMPPLEMIRHDAVQGERALDQGLRQAAREVEQGGERLQATLPMPAAPDAPAPEPAPSQKPVPVIGAARQGVDATMSAVDQGVQQISGEVQGAVRETAEGLRQGVRQQADGLKQQIQQTADQLEQKAATQTRRATETFLKKVEQQGKDTLKHGTDRLKDQIRREVAPAKP